MKLLICLLQQDKPDDYVIATGKQHSVREFITWSANALGIKLKFEGEGANEIAKVSSIYGDLAPALKIGQIIVRIDSKYFRPAEVETLLGDSTKARKNLSWEPKITAKEMCHEMIKEDYKIAQRFVLLKKHGMQVPFSAEG